MSETDNIFKDAPKFQYEEELKETSPLEFEHILQNRRSVRVYTNEPVPKEIVQKVLDWALLAPNSSNLQCWEFYWIQNPRVKSEVVEACLNQPAAKTAQEIIVAVAKLDGWKTVRKQMIDLFNSQDNIPKSARSYYEKLVPLAYNQGPLGIVGLFKKVAMKMIGFFRPVPREPSSWADMRVWGAKTVALACENIMLGFAAHGYDTCPMEGYDSARMNKALKLDSNSDVVMAISVGKRDKNGVYGPRIRMPREQFIKII